MATPRSESIKLALSDHVGAVRSHHNAGGVEGKIDHYAYMARVIHAGVEGFFESDYSLAEIAKADSVKALDHVMTSTLLLHLTLALESPEFEELTAHLEASQAERRTINPAYHPSIEWTLIAGVNTYMNTSAGLYSALEESFGVEVASSPTNASIIDRLSKLNISQFIPYKHTYLDNAADSPMPNVQYFIKQFDKSPSGDVRFKVNFPGNALIPVPATQNKGMWGTEDFLVDGNKTTLLRDIPPDIATVGCPISFDPAQGRQLWALYAEARRTIGDRSAPNASVKSLGGIAASAQPKL